MTIIDKIVLTPVFTVQQTTPKVSHLKQKFMIISQILRDNWAQLGSSYQFPRCCNQMAAEPGVI